MRKPRMRAVEYAPVAQVPAAVQPQVIYRGFRDIWEDFVYRTKVVLFKLSLFAALVGGLTCFTMYKITGFLPFVHDKSIIALEKQVPVAVSDNPATTNIDEAASLKALALVQVKTGQSLNIPQVRDDYSKEELLSMIKDVAEEMCRKRGKCVPSVILQGIGSKESVVNAGAIALEKKLVDAKFKPLEGESALSQALSPFSFGLMQVNWGYSKEICEDMLIDEGGDKSSLYVLLLNPRINIQCAILVFLEKWEMAKKFEGAKRMTESIRLYNGKNAPQQYVMDVMGHVTQILAREVKG